MSQMRNIIERVIQDPVSAVFVAAALFAAGSVGFFIAVALQARAPQDLTALKPLTETEKITVMESLDASTDTQGRSMTDARADAGLTTDQKLDILKSLNAN